MTQRTASILVSVALSAVALFLVAVPRGTAAPPAAPKTLELGKGPTVVIAHDMGGNRMSWMPTVRKLIGKHRVVLVDLPGHGAPGDSPLPDPFTLEAAAEALDQVLAKQNPDSTVLVGKGVGGLLSLLDLKAHPTRVRGLVLVESSLKSPIPIDDQRIARFQRQLDANYDGILKMLYTRMGRDSAQGVAIHAMAAQTPPQTIKAYLGASLTADGSPALKALQVPLLFIATDRLLKGKDWATAAKELGFDDPASIPMRRISDAGYMVMQDQPDTLAAVIAEFTAQTLAAKKK